MKDKERLREIFKQVGKECMRDCLNEFTDAEFKMILMLLLPVYTADLCSRVEKKLTEIENNA